MKAFDRLKQMTGTKVSYQYMDENRSGDHICYISNLARFQSHYPRWEVSKLLDDIFREIVDSWKPRLDA